MSILNNLIWEGLPGKGTLKQKLEGFEGINLSNTWGKRKPSDKGPRQEHRWHVPGIAKKAAVN